MGVPSSGTLEMIKIARERRWGNYSGNGTITGPISMYNLILGGNTGGAVNSGDTYLSPNPSSPTVLPGAGPGNQPWRFSNFYGYVQITARTAFNYVFSSSKDIIISKTRTIQSLGVSFAFLCPLCIATVRF